MSLDSKATASLQMSFQSDQGTDNSKCKYTLRKLKARKKSSCPATGNTAGTAARKYSNKNSHYSGNRREKNPKQIHLRIHSGN